MNTLKETTMAVTQETAITTAVEPAQSKPTATNAQIHWATGGGAATMSKPELEEKFEAMRARNWITDRMVQQYQQHWHCSREVALERLLSKVSS